MNTGMNMNMNVNGNKCQSLHPLERPLFVDLPSAKDTHPHSYNYHQHHHHYHHHHHRQQYHRPRSSSPLSSSPHPPRLCVACVCATVRNPTLLHTVRQAALRHLQPLLLMISAPSSQSHVLSHVHLPVPVPVAVSNINVDVASFLVDRLFQVVADEGRVRTPSPIVTDVIQWLSSYAHKHNHANGNEKIFERCFSTVLTAIITPSNSKPSQPHNHNPNLVALLYALCSPSQTNHNDKDIGTHRNKRYVIIYTLLTQFQHRHRQFIVCHLVANLSTCSSDDEWSVVCRTIVFLLHCLRQHGHDHDHDHIIDSDETKTKTNTSSLQMQMVSHMITLIHTRLPCRRSMSLEMAYLSVVQCVLSLYPSIITYHTDDNGNGNTTTTTFSQHLFPVSVSVSVSRSSSPSSSPSPFLSILKKSLLSTSRPLVDLALDVAALVACDPICNEHGVFDYVMETLRGGTPNLNALHTIVSLAPFAHWTKWAYVIPIIMQCIQSYSRHQLVNINNHNSNNNSYRHHHHHHLIAIIHAAFSFAPVQTFSPTVVQHTSAFIIRLYMQRRAMFVVDCHQQRQSSLPHDERRIDGDMELEEKIKTSCNSNSNNNNNNSSNTNRKEMDVIKTGLDALFILSQRYDAGADALTSLVELCSLGCDPVVTFIRSSCLRLFVECVKQYKRLVRKYFHGVQKQKKQKQKQKQKQEGVLMPIHNHEYKHKHDPEKKKAIIKGNNNCEYNMNTGKTSQPPSKAKQIPSPTPLLSSRVKHHCTGEDQQMRDQLRNLGDLIIGNITQSWMILFHGRLSTLEMAVGFFHEGSRDIISVFELFSHVLDPIFSDVVGCKSTSINNNNKNPNVRNVRKWCWENLPVRLGFQLCKRAGHESDPSLNQSLKRKRRKTAVHGDVASDFDNASNAATPPTESGDVNKNMTQCEKVVTQYFCMLLLLGGGAGVSSRRKNEERHDSIPIEITTEQAFLNQLSSCPSSLSSPSSSSSSSSSSSTSLSLNVCTRMLQVGVMFRNVQCISQPDSIISALSHRVHQLATQCQNQCHQGLEPYHRRRHSADIVETLRYSAAICIIHHMQFPPALLSAETLRAFTSLGAVRTEVDFSLFLKFISMNTGQHQQHQHRNSQPTSMNINISMSMSMSMSMSQNHNSQNMSQAQSQSQNVSSQGRQNAGDHGHDQERTATVRLWEMYIYSRQQQQNAGNEHDARRRYREWDRTIIRETLTKNIDCAAGLVDTMMNAKQPYAIVRYLLSITASLSTSLNASEKNQLFGHRRLCRRLIMLVTEIDDQVRNKSVGGESSNWDMFASDVHRVCAILHFLLEFHHSSHQYQYYTYEQSNLIPVLISILPSSKEMFSSTGSGQTNQHEREFAFLLRQLHSSILRFIVLALFSSSSSSSSSALASSSLSSSSSEFIHIQSPQVPTQLISHCVSFLLHVYNSESTKDRNEMNNHDSVATLTLSQYSPSSLYRYPFYSPSSFIDLSISSAACFLTLCLKDRRLRDQSYQLLCANLAKPHQWDRLLGYTINKQTYEGLSKDSNHGTTIVMTEIEDDLIKKARIGNVCKLLETFISHADRHDTSFSSFDPFISNGTLTLISAPSTSSPSSLEPGSSMRTAFILQCVQRASYMLLTILLRTDPVGFKDTVKNNMLCDITNNLISTFHGFGYENNQLSIAEVALLEQMLHLSIVECHLIDIHNVLLRQWNYHIASSSDRDQIDNNNGQCERRKEKEKHFLSRLATVFLVVANTIKRDKHSSEKSFPDLVPEQTSRDIQQYASHFLIQTLPCKTEQNLHRAGEQVEKTSDHTLKGHTCTAIETHNLVSLIHDEAIVIWEH